MNDHIDRPALAAALRPATVAVLRVDVEEMEQLAMTIDPHTASEIAVFPHQRETFRRLAALALAVATMQENGNDAALGFFDDKEKKGVRWYAHADGQVYIDWFPDDSGDSGDGHATLPAALAKLVREGA